MKFVLTTEKGKPCLSSVRRRAESDLTQRPRPLLITGIYSISKHSETKTVAPCLTI